MTDNDLTAPRSPLGQDRLDRRIARSTKAAQAHRGHMMRTQDVIARHRVFAADSIALQARTWPIDATTKIIIVNGVFAIAIYFSAILGG